MIDLDQIADFIIQPTLEDLGMYSLSAAELVLGTGIQESRFTYLAQLDKDKDPFDMAIGFFQMETRTHDDIWNNYLKYHDITSETVRRMVVKLDAREMLWNLRYACAMCRLHYRRVKAPLPVAGDLEGQARYWKQYYNTSLGKGTVEEYIKHWEEAHDR